MSVTNTTTDREVRGLLPAHLADAQLDHVERMIQYCTRPDAGPTFRGIDHEYWKKRLRTLTETYDLVTPQRQRVMRMFDLLERQVLLKMRAGQAA
jgi:hypothetical protein